MVFHRPWANTAKPETFGYRSFRTASGWRATEKLEMFGCCFIYETVSGWQATEKLAIEREDTSLRRVTPFLNIYTQREGGQIGRQPIIQKIYTHHFHSRRRICRPSFGNTVAFHRAKYKNGTLLLFRSPVSRKTLYALNRHSTSFGNKRRTIF